MGIRASGGAVSGSELKEIVERFNERFSAVPGYEIYQEVEGVGDPVVIDIAQGAYVVLSLKNDVSSLPTFANWLPDPLVTRVTLEVHGNGHSLNLGFASPAGDGLYEIIIRKNGRVKIVHRLDAHEQVQEFVSGIDAGTPDVGTPALTVHTN